MSRTARLLVLLLALPLWGALEKQDVMIPVRDGVRLHTAIWRDTSLHDRLPFLIIRTPYGIAGAKNQLDRSLAELVQEGYIFVFQDIRGRYESGGQFVMERLPRDRTVAGSIDEGTDTYDTIDWLLKNVPDNNGRAGITGISYGGWLTQMALFEPHPALKAASEQASPGDMFLNDDFHHNGAFRLSYGFEYVAMMETGKENFNFQFDAYDTFDWYLRLGPLANANRLYFKGERPTWNNFVQHPTFDAFWKAADFPKFLQHVTVPDLHVAGWFDQEDGAGPFEFYREASASDGGRLNYIVVGPWNHGGWSRGDGNSLGNIKFGSDTSKYFREKVQAAWFAYWLKDKGSKDFPAARMFQTGANQWKSYDAWPPVKGIEKRGLYLRDGGKLSFDPPKEAQASDSFISDPAHPVPYRARPIPPTYQGPGWSTWHTDDQRFAEGRLDVATWKTEPLTEDVSIAGEVIARIFASTTGTDADWIAKLIDVYPDVNPAESAMGGYELMVGADVLRGRFRAGMDRPMPVKADEVVEYDINLLSRCHRFLKGHRIMVQIQSTWFPVIDRNPQKYVPNIFEAAESDFQKATHRVFRSARYPSQIVLPLER
jgi:putative CocE/NonD family hydrolase